MTQFPWKQLLHLLAENGYCLINYPTIRLPGQVYEHQAKTKAISDLVSAEVIKLGIALGLIPTKPAQPLLKLKRASKELKQGPCLQ